MSACPFDFGRVKTKGRPLYVMAHIKGIIFDIKAERNCLAHVLIIGVAKWTNDPNCNAYRQGRKILPAVQNLLTAKGIDLSNAAGIPEIEGFQDILRVFCFSKTQRRDAGRKVRI
jgi:hypothetical protein